MARAWTVPFDTFALSTTPKTAVLLIAGAQEALRVTEICVAIDGTQQVIVELVASTGTTTGTAGSSPTPTQVRGFIAAGATAPAQITAGIKYSAEPTTLSVLKRWRFVGPGPFVLQSPLGREVESLQSAASAYEAIGLRLSVSTGTPNAEGYMEFEP